MILEVFENLKSQIINYNIKTTTLWTHSDKIKYIDSQKYNCCK